MGYGECVITGCSGQICAEDTTLSDCVYLDWYACFQYSECGNYGTDGNCSWLFTDSFLYCIESFKIFKLINCLLTRILLDNKHSF